MQRARPGRSTPLIHGLTAIGLVVAVVAVAYGTQSPQLAVAEFAPSAQRSIDAPPTTSEPSGAEAGRGDARRSTTTTSAPATPSSADTAAQSGPPTTEVGRTRNCVGNPARQIEDPMSPPCSNVIFEGDNGGATATGVTATEIAIGFPHNGWCTGDPCVSMITALFDFFNQRFEFYGRRLKPVFVNGTHSDPIQARTLGAQVAAQRVFGAVTSGVEWNSVDQSIFQELGRQHVVTVMRGNHSSDRTLFDELHPYVWSALPSSEQWQSNTADFVCKALAGRPAIHAGAPELRTQTRKFGVIAGGRSAAPTSQTLVEGLRACGADVQVLSWASVNDSSRQQLRTGLESFKAAGITTVTCVCTGTSPTAGALGGLANVPGYLPEVLTPVISEPSDEWWANGAYRGSLFGITARPKLLPLQTQPWYQAMVAMAPDLLAKQDYNASLSAKLTYDLLLVMAAGIQGAGPRLTPDTFAAALMTMKFPNAGSGQAPYWQPAVGFGAGDHSFVDDYAVSWWNDDAPAVEFLNTRPTGSWCYLGQGTRWSTGSFPTDLDARLFSEQPCR